MKCSEILIEDVSSSDIGTIVTCLTTDCKPYFQINPHMQPLWRGITHNMQQVVPGLYFDLTVSDRPPRDSNEQVHAAMDLWFENQFGIRFRSDNIMFATGSKRYADDYAGSGKAMRVFPIGNIDYLWSGRYGDVYVHMPMSSDFDDDVIDHIMKRGDFRLNKDFDTALASQHEIMVKCYKYYALDCSQNMYETIMYNVQETLR